jgi:hydroxyacylglutathione hydrolase
LLKAALIPVTPFQQNCTLLWEDATRRGAVVDPGGDVPQILQEIDRCGVTVEKILLTHGHLDHAGGATALKAALATRSGGALPIEGPHLADRFLLDGIEDQAAHFGLSDLYDAEPDRWLQEGDTVEAAGRSFAVLHCPGHTPGHIVFVDRGAKFALVGDVLFRGSIGRTDFPYGDHAALLRSIHEKLIPLGDEFSFLCGHGPGSSIGVERRTNPFLR